MDAETDDPQEPAFHGAPFDDDDADIILRSSDGIDFKTFRFLLRKSGSFFTGMFSLPQPPVVPHLHGVDLIHIPEDRHVLGTLLAAITPLTEPYPLPQTFEALLPVLVAAQKYGMTSALVHLRARTFHGPDRVRMPENLLWGFAIAWHHHLEYEVRLIAWLSLEEPMTLHDLTPVFHLTAGLAFDRLALYRGGCRTIIAERLDALREGTRFREDGIDHIRHSCPPHSGNVARWWARYMQELKDWVDRDGLDSVIIAPASVFSPPRFAATMTRHAWVHECPACKSFDVMAKDNWWLDMLDDVEHEIAVVSKSSFFPPVSTLTISSVVYSRIRLPGVVVSD